MSVILDKLAGGDRRSIGRAAEVVADVLDDPGLFDAVFWGMLHADPVVRMRAADVVEKVTRERSGYLQPYRAALLGEVARVPQQEVRWHVAQMLPRLALEPGERAQVVQLLLGYLQDESKIVKTSAMQALADLAAEEPRLQARVIPLVEELVRTGSPAVQSRGRKLLAQLRQP
jgi:HEAT repeat protein